MKYVYSLVLRLQDVGIPRAKARDNGLRDSLQGLGAKGFGVEVLLMLRLTNSSSGSLFQAGTNPPLYLFQASGHLS